VLGYFLHLQQFGVEHEPSRDVRTQQLTFSSVLYYIPLSTFSMLPAPATLRAMVLIEDQCVGVHFCYGHQSTSAFAGSDG